MVRYGSLGEVFAQAWDKCRQSNWFRLDQCKSNCIWIGAEEVGRSDFDLVIYNALLHAVIIFVAWISVGGQSQ